MIQNAVRRSPIIFLLIWLSSSHGCDSAEQFDRADALSELQSVLPDVPADVEILFYKNDESAGNSQWIYITSTSPIIGKQEIQASEKLPGESLVSYSLSVGVPETSLSAPAEPFGLMTETQVNGGSLRSRSVRLKAGFLCVVELLP